jgi:hypothetical protein
VPFQLDINMSSPSARPYEHASTKHKTSAIWHISVSSPYSPAPRPFSPFSNSSRSLKFLGTLDPIVLLRIGRGVRR